MMITNEGSGNRQRAEIFFALTAGFEGRRLLVAPMGLARPAAGAMLKSTAADRGERMMSDLLATAADAEAAADRAARAAGVVVRELVSLDEHAAMIELIDEVWEPEDGNSSIRLDLTRALVKAGNYASGAYDRGTGQLLGACIGFFGPPAHAELHSHIAGVRAAGLGRSVGFALKVHQRAWCLRHGVRVIAWTFDPLIRRNAYFNLVKLGARPTEYLRNFYGAMDDAINAGTETDRLLVHWDLLSERAADASAGRPAPGSFAAERSRGATVVLSADPDGRPVPGGPNVDGALSTGGVLSPGEGGTFLVGVPADIEAMRVGDPALGASWRTALRDALAPLVAGGARVTGFDRSGWYIVSTDKAGHE
jgi:predicted GNAT superfamily acetyltransferase